MGEFEREIIRVNSWQEIIERPDHVTNVDPKKTKLLHILSGYELKDKQPCGLVGKHRHRRGFLVVIEGERTTHIGKDCAATHFGADIVKGLVSRYRDAADRRDQSERFERQIVALPVLRAEYDALRFDVFRAVNRIEICMRSLPRALEDKLHERSRRQESTVEDARRRSAAEIDDLIARGDRRPRDALLFEPMLIGTFQGLSAVVDATSAKRLLSEKILLPIKSLELARDSRTQARRSVMQDIDDITNTTNILRRFCDASALFTSRENLELVQKLSRILRVAA